MAQVEIDIDMDEISTDDLLQEVEDRWKNKHHKKLKTLERKWLLDIVSASNASVVPQDTLNDVLKLEHVASCIEKYTLSELQQILNR